MRIHSVDQFIPSLALRDAIGSHTLEVRRIIEEMGYRCNLYVGNAVPELTSQSKPFGSYQGGEGHVALYQASTGSPIAEFLHRRGEPLLLSYHNLTPPEMFDPWEPAVAQELEAGRQQMALLAERTSHAICDSSYNEEELVALGYRSTSVAPPLVDPRAGAKEADGGVAEWLKWWRAAGNVVILFVGRVAPNKAQEDLIKSFAVYHRYYNPNSRLCLVGSAASERYMAALRWFVDHLGLSKVVDLTGGVSGEELLAYYEGSDVFLCLSDHEGYCVPLIESMHHDLPVIAHQAAAVPETAGNAALLLASKRPTQVAAAIDRLIKDRDLQDYLVGEGRRRAGELSLAANRERFRTALAAALEAL